MINTIRIKVLLTTIFGFTVAACSAQKQLLSYQDLQYIMQNKTEQVADFMKQKDYYSQPPLGNGIRFFTLYADTDYTDVSISLNGRHTNIHLSTTDAPQIELIKKALSIYTSKNSKGSKIYRIKDGTISTASLTEIDQKGTLNKLVSIDLEN